MKAFTLFRTGIVAIIMMAILITGMSVSAQEEIIPENFGLNITADQLSEIKTAMQNRDKETVQALFEEYDISMGDLMKFRQAYKKGHRGPSEEVKAALESGDYAAFQEAIREDGPFAEAIDSEDKFAQLIALHEAKQDGDRETAQQIADELGLKKPGRSHKGFGSQLSEEERAAAKEAVQNGDYNAWISIVGSDSKIAEKVTTENFSDFQALHEARENGDKETARKIADELELKRHGHGHGGKGGRFKGPNDQSDTN